MTARATRAQQEAIDAGPAQQRITGYWDWRGAAYDDVPRHGLFHAREREAWLRTLAQLFPRPPADVLDVGTGTGFLALLLAQLGHRVTGVDLAEKMLAATREKAAGLEPAPVFVLGDAHDPPGVPERFDVVTNRHVLWTLLEPDRALRAWWRRLRPGGRLIAIDGLWWLERQEPQPEETPTEVQHRYREHYSDAVQTALPLRQATSIEPVLALARDAGFADVRVTRLDEIAAVESEVLPQGGGMREPRYAITATRPG